MRMDKILFTLRRWYLRFDASYPKRLTEDEILSLGKKMWRNFIENNESENNFDCLWKFQSYALKLDFVRLFSLQEYLDDHYTKLSKDYFEHDSKTANDMYTAYKEKIYAYLHAIR